MTVWRIGSLLVCGAALAGPAPPPTVGIEAALEAVVPAPEVSARPVDGKAKIVVRIAQARPHGTAFRYDLRYTGFVPGVYDLRSCLLRADGSTVSNTVPLMVTIAPLLPKNHNGELDAESAGGLPHRPWYGASYVTTWLIWGVLLMPLALYGRRRLRRNPVVPPPPPPTLAELLEPLVSRALSGPLSPADQAELEHYLLLFWRTRLGLGQSSHAEAVAALRSHPEAGAVLEALERWLYQPPGRGAVDLGALLEPYRGQAAPSAAEGRP